MPARIPIEKVNFSKRTQITLRINTSSRRLKPRVGIAIELDAILTTSPQPADRSRIHRRGRNRYHNGMSLMSDIRAFPVPKNSVALWWLGQNGFIFKSHEGTVISTDLYLTNSCAEVY